MQASLLAAAARTAEVAGLKRDLERSKEELGLTKRQLEETKGKKYPVCLLKKRRIVMNFTRGHDRSGGPEEGAVRGRRQSSHGARRAREARGPNR